MGNTLMESSSRWRRLGFGFIREGMIISHIHLPDGVLPWVWWIAADILATGWLLLALRRVQRGGKRLQLPLLGALGACMLLTMSVPLGPLPLHLNLTILTGILAGPWLGFITVFLVNAMLSLLGHGGLTVLGLNSLIMGVEVLLGWWFFHRLLRRWPLGRKAFLATVLALLVSVSLSFGFIGWSTGQWAAILPGADHQLHQHEQQIAVHSVQGSEQSPDGSLAVALSRWEFFGQTGLLALASLLGMGLFCEAAATLVIARYLQQVRPELLLLGAD